VRVGFSTGAKERPHQQQEAVRRALAQLGKAGRETIPYKVSLEEVRELYRKAGLHDVSTSIRTFVDFEPDVDEVILHSSASSFGNFLAQLTDDERRAARAALAQELEAYRTPQGLRLERYLIVGVAAKQVH
jgi:arsenite methyltransferase